MERNDRLYQPKTAFSAETQTTALSVICANGAGQFVLQPLGITLDQGSHGERDFQSHGKLRVRSSGATPDMSTFHTPSS